MKFNCFIAALSCCNFIQANVFESAASWYNSMTNLMSDYYCSTRECCNDKNVPYNIQSLKSILSAKLYGQHIASDIVLNAVNSHVKKQKPRKPLVMSFHGANGVGKTYVSRIIAKAMYEKEDESQHFHFYYGLDNFPLISKVSEYKAHLRYDIEAAMHNCEKSLFIFDGVDQMPAGLLDVLMPFIDCPSCVGKVKKNKSIFIFLTNTGSLAIQMQLLKKMKQGLKRESTSLQDFEEIIVLETFNKTGGLFESLMIKSDAIDFYVPFLPLERIHVEHCIEEALIESEVSPTKDLIDQVFEELRFGPEPQNLFSISGCKRVSQIAGRIASRLEPYFISFNGEKNPHRSEL